MALKETPICDVGSPAPAFDLPDPDGQRHTLETCRGARATLVMFICNHCPYVQAIRERLVRDTTELAAIGVGSVAIMSNDTADYPDDAPDKMRAEAARYGYPFPYLVDESQEIAHAYGAVCTPDFFGYNADLKLQYRGRLDASGMTPTPAARRELFEAMQEIAATGRGPAQQTPSMGCSIKWRRTG